MKNDFDNNQIYWEIIMPLMEFEVQREIAKFYKNSKDIMKEFISYNIKKNEEELNKIENYLDLLDKAWMEMEYIKYNQDYYRNFANNFEESHLLQESGYVIFDLDEYEVNTLNGKGTRDWIYECELCDFKEKLLENKRKIKDILTQSYISAGVSLALLRS